ncbi:Aste57867_11249 [Aphanomyces stellatus]|uniref:Aste57867_11249 protein n=1 Tax=Aphanomyces stellatus TaxID=120398 RepID=A0A485KSZ6_9STRA|nr:hypothetical protein As57867_011207 [Aphanomyces stellatus]VFT88114.1 Aste57867_11249 [Aphanomyces stellatus]
MKDNTAFISTGEPIYLYLVDEVEGVPVVPSEPGQVYPIRIDVQSPQFLAIAAPFLQTSVILLNGIKAVTKMAKCVGISNPTGPVLDKAIIRGYKKGHEIESSEGSKERRNMHVRIDVDWLVKFSNNFFKIILRNKSKPMLLSNLRDVDVCPPKDHNEN